MLVKNGYWIDDLVRQVIGFGALIFTGRSAEAGLELTFRVSQSLTKTQMSHLEASNAKSAQSKDV